MTATVAKETLRRVISDITDIVKHPLHDNGIYYEHDEENILKGYVLIIPQSESPYQYGNYLFTVDFPTNYPYSPPSMKFMTNNGHTRMHPNLYRNGKVCLSLLNTWKGDKWTACNTLSSVLLHLATLFTDKPFLHEPGVTESHCEFDSYTNIIQYQNYNTAVLGILTNTVNTTIREFDDVVKENYKKKKDAIIDKVKDLYERPGKRDISVVSFYKMEEIIDYENLYLKLKEYNANI
jgi:ubiquitin-conjugating enzyme E2 Z